MSEGLYYVIGGVKGGKCIRETIIELSKPFSENASVLYIGAANDDDPTFKRNFIGSLKTTDLQVYSLSLSWTVPNDIQTAFNRADIIFFDGGEIATLETVFNKHGLKTLCQQAFERGACVGGLCAGGSYFGSTVIHEESETPELKIDNGLGLIESTTITCYIGDQAQGQRLSMLENVSYQRNQIGLGVPINQAVTWNREQGFKKLLPDTIGPVIYRP